MNQQPRPASRYRVFAQLNLRFNIDQSIHYGPGFAAAATTAVATAAIALRRRAPLLTVCAVAAAFAGPELITRLTVKSVVPVISARCVVPDSDGASLILNRQEEDALWQVFFTAAPERRRVFEPSSKRRKKAPGPLRRGMA